VDKSVALPTSKNRWASQARPSLQALSAESGMSSSASTRNLCVAGKGNAFMLRLRYATLSTNGAYFLWLFSVRPELVEGQRDGTDL
jgi:hypothetical protein